MAATSIQARPPAETSCCHHHGTGSRVEPPMTVEADPGSTDLTAA